MHAPELLGILGINPRIFSDTSQMPQVQYRKNETARETNSYAIVFDIYIYNSFFLSRSS